MESSVPDALPWRIGGRVAVRGYHWNIVDVTRGRDCVALRLAPLSIDSRARHRTLLVPFDRPKGIDTRPRATVLRPRAWLHELRRRLSQLHPYGAFTAAGSTRVRLIPFQLEPALAVLRHGATRVLIADAVGLGKTIQAGLLLVELSAVFEMFRALVLVPAGLREQWKHELQAQFDLTATIADTAWLQLAATERPADVNPWSLPGIYIASQDFVKRPEVLRALEDVTWDLLVLDEAHAATRGSDRRAAAHALGVRSRRLILLTATPHADNPQEFEALCLIGAVGAQGDPVVLFRRSRQDVGPHTPRRPAVLLVRPSDDERRMHELLDRYTRQVWTESVGRNDALAKLAVILLRKRALSSAASLSVSIARRLELLAGAAPASTEQLRLPLGEEDPLDDEQPDAVLGAPGLADGTRERRWLATIAEAAQRAARRETKAAFLLRLLARVQEPVIVFTEYRDTLVRLERAIASTGRSTAVLHGAMSPAERSRVQRAFNDSDLLLVATDAAAEGLNLQARCRVIVHYELPWSGSRLEQRAGRVDRLGQTKRVHEIALVANDTAERLVLAPLVQRAAQAARAGGVPTGVLDALTESRAAELVMFGSAAKPLAPINGTPASARRIDLAAEAQVEAARLEQIRVFGNSFSSPCSSVLFRGSCPCSSVFFRGPASGRQKFDGPILTIVRPRRRQSGKRLILIYRISLGAPGGRPEHQEAIAFELRFERPFSAGVTFRAMRELVHPFLAPDHPVVYREVSAAVQNAMGFVGPLRTNTCRQLAMREDAIAAAHGSVAAQLVQASLFDRRTLRELSRRERIRRSLLDDADSHKASLWSELAADVEFLGALV